jgi:hypothetical protein
MVEKGGKGKEMSNVHHMKIKLQYIKKKKG